MVTTTTTTTTATLDTSGQMKPGSPTRSPCAHREIHFWIYTANLWVRYTVIHTALLTNTTVLILLLLYYYSLGTISVRASSIILLYDRMYNEIKIYETAHNIIYKLFIIIIILILQCVRIVTCM